MIIYIIENKRLSKTENIRMYKTKYKNKSKLKSKIQHTTKHLDKYIK